MTAPNPRVSIGMPIYNGERHVEETIESLLVQSFADFELVISDNASSDRTEAICRSYAVRDARVRYYRNPENLGGSKNFSRVVELARAPLFKWAAHDDLCAPTLLEKCVAVLDTHPNVVVCYPRRAFIDERGAVLVDHDDKCNLRSPQPSVRVRQFLAFADTHCFPMFGLIRRDILQKTSLIAPYVSSDQILLLQLALSGEFYELPDRLFFFREHAARSIRTFRTYAEYLSWHDPKKRSPIQLPRWRLVLEFLRAIARAPLGPCEARNCYLSVLKWCRWHCGSLAGDLVRALRQTLALTLGWAPPREKIGILPEGMAADPG